jgi:hypothetical protein
MAATTKKRAAKPKKRADAKKQAGSNSKTPKLAAKHIPAKNEPVSDSDVRDKKLKLAEALREEGIGVRKIAQGFATMHYKLGRSDDKGDLKLFFDVLKENHRTLEPPRPPDRGGASDAPVTVILNHNVPRPAR